MNNNIKNGTIKNTVKKINNIYIKKYAKLFDKLYHENLMCIYDSFAEIPLKYLVTFDNKIWDVRLLCEQWAHLLCSSDMQNASPIFPSNPYTKKNIMKEDINNIILCLKINKHKIYKPLKYLLNNINSININSININSYNTDSKLKQEIVSLLNKKFRFRLICNKNSQDNYIGVWVNIREKLSDFEVYYRYYESIPIQTQSIYGITDNYERIEFKEQLDNYPQEYINMNMYSEFM